MRPLLAFWALCCAAACATEPDSPPPLPPGAVQFNPDPVYAQYWAQIEACANRTRAMAKVTWYYVPGFDPFPAPGIAKPVLGYWHPADNRIVLLQYVPDPPALIRHQMLHAVLQRTDHPALYFQQRCGSTIAGPPLPPD